MMSDYIDEIWGTITKMDLDEVWEEYKFHQKYGEKEYANYERRCSEPYPDYLLDGMADSDVGGYDWKVIEGLFRERLGEEFHLGPVAGKMNRELPVHGQDKPKPKV